MNKKRFIIIGIIVVAAATIFWLKKSPTGQSAEITIGAIAPLSGQISVLGERMRNGMELAKEDLIREGAVKSLNIIYEDACDGKSTTNAGRKLIYADKVKIIASSFCLFGTDTIVPIAEQEKVILFNTAANPESVLNKKYVFSTNITIKDDAYKMAEYAAGALKGKTAAMIHLQTSFGESYRNNFTDKFTALGGKVLITEAKTADAQDFRTELTKIKAANPDVLVMIHFGISLGNAIKQARELGIQAPIIGDYESEDPTVLAFAGQAAEGFVISSSQPQARTSGIKKFEEAYKAKYGELPDVLATNAYDSLRLQIAAYTACAGDTACIAAQLENTKNYPGVSGAITINPTDHSVYKPTVFKIVRNGSFVAL